MTLQEKCSLNNVCRLERTAHSTIRDFLSLAELRIVNEVTFQSTLERVGNPKPAVKTIKQECQRELDGPLPVLKRLQLMKKLLPLALNDGFYS